MVKWCEFVKVEGGPSQRTAQYLLDDSYKGYLSLCAMLQRNPCM